MLLVLRLLLNPLLLSYLPLSLGKGLRRTRYQVVVRGLPPVKSVPEDVFLRRHYAWSELPVTVHCSCTCARLVQHPGFLLPGKIGLLRQFRGSSDSSLAARWCGPGTSGFRVHRSS